MAATITIGSRCVSTAAAPRCPPPPPSSASSTNTRRREHARGEKKKTKTALKTQTQMQMRQVTAAGRGRADGECRGERDAAERPGGVDTRELSAARTRRALLAGCASWAGLGLGVISTEPNGGRWHYGDSPRDGSGAKGSTGSGGCGWRGWEHRLTAPAAADAADVASFVSLDALVEQVRAASGELALMSEALSTSVALGTAPPLKELKRRLGADALAQLPAAATRLDRFIDAAPLEDWETAVWSSVSEETRGSRDIEGVTGTRLAGVERTNDFLCLVFSCFNDPRAPASTDALLSLKLLGDGVSMGLRGDDRITAEGLTLSVQDVSEKLAAYLEVVESSKIVAAKRASSRD